LKYDSEIQIGSKLVSFSNPTYFVADIASNHDGDFERAKALIHIAKAAGADAVKFQHFKAEKIVSDKGFRDLGNSLSHQSKWGKPVFEIYRQYEFRREWYSSLLKEAKEADVDLMTTPYDLEAVESLNEHLPAYKIGSGDITWTDFIDAVSRLGKPMLLATGASTMEDVDRAVKVVLETNRKIVLMQCNTNYTGLPENFNYVNLRVIQTFARKYPGMVLGLSDHTPGHSAVLGGIALGARVVEKHFTDDNNRKGPDHMFSMNPRSWSEMIKTSRELEAAFGDGIKRIEDNEKETVVLQQRCLRLVKDLPKGHVISGQDVEALRPAPPHAYRPFQVDQVMGRTTRCALQRGHALSPSDLEEKC
jgi:sialic acid synthase SpsE